MEFIKYGSKFVSVLDDISEPTYLVTSECIRRRSFTITTVTAALEVYEGFKILCQAKNYLCAIQLIRVQIDNCLMVYGSLIMKNQKTFFDNYERGTDINKLKIEGKPLTTNFLLSGLEEKYNGLTCIYREGCKWVHPTSKRADIFCIDSPTPNVPVSILGYKGKEYMNSNRLAEELMEDLCTDMYYVNDVLLELLNEVVKLQHETITNR